MLQILPKDGDIGDTIKSLGVYDKNEDDDDIILNVDYIQECNIPKLDNTHQQSIIDQTLELDYPEQVHIFLMSLYMY